MEKAVVGDNFPFLMRLEYPIALHFFDIRLYPSNKPPLDGVSMNGLLLLATRTVLSKTLDSPHNRLPHDSASNLSFCNERA